MDISPQRHVQIATSLKANKAKNWFPSFLHPVTTISDIYYYIGSFANISSSMAIDSATVAASATTKPMPWLPCVAMTTWPSSGRPKRPPWMPSRTSPPPRCARSAPGWSPAKARSPLHPGGWAIRLETQRCQMRAREAQFLIFSIFGSIWGIHFTFQEGKLANKTENLEKLVAWVNCTPMHLDNLCPKW